MTLPIGFPKKILFGLPVSSSELHSGTMVIRVQRKIRTLLWQKNQCQEDQEGLKLKETYQFLIYINNNYSQRKKLKYHKGNTNSKISYSTDLGPDVNAGDTRVIQKISSVCKYCYCSAVVTMVCMCAEFVDSVARHGRNLQTFEQCLRIMLCVYNVQENRESRRM